MPYSMTLGSHLLPPSNLAWFVCLHFSLLDAGRMKATHDYVAKNANELTFKEVSHRPGAIAHHSPNIV